MPHHIAAAALTERLALEREGVVAYRSLLAAGLTRWNVSCLERDRHLHRMLPGIYVVGLPHLNQRQLWRSAELVAGEHGGLTGRSVFEHGGRSRTATA